MKDPNDPLVDDVSDYLKQQTAQLDPQIQQELDRIRAEAVQVAGQGSTKGWLANAGYAAAFSLAVVAAVITLNTSPVNQTDTPSPLEVVLINEDFEMLEQELAFYDWVETELSEQG